MGKDDNQSLRSKEKSRRAPLQEDKSQRNQAVGKEDQRSKRQRESSASLAPRLGGGSGFKDPVEAKELIEKREWWEKGAE